MPTTMRPWTRLSAVVAVLALALTAAAPLHADEQSEINKKVEGASDDLEAANAAVAKAAAALKEAQAKLPPAQRMLDEAIARERAAQQVVQEATVAYQQAVAEYQAAQQRLQQIEAQYEDLRANVGDFARRAYQMGPFAEIEMVLDASDPGEFSDRLEVIRSISKANNTALGKMAANRADQSYTQMRMEALQELAQEKKALAEAKLKEAEAAKAEAAAAKEAVDKLIEQRDGALVIAEAQRSAVLGQYRALQEEQARIARAAQEAAELARGLEGFNWSSADGFEWPIPNARIAQLPGPRIHPVYGYRSCHTGVDVAAGTGTPIRATQSGVVAFISNGGPYGLHTLIAHGDGVASMYAHQSRTAVAGGQRVNRGDVIGYVGSTGWVTGPHLHFEIHVDGVPFNPLGWFGQAKKPIGC